MINSVKVKLWDHLVGMLVWDKKQHTSYFYFNPAFKKTGLKPFPLFLHPKVLSGDIPAYGDNLNPMNQKLPYFIAGSLPDDWGNELFEQWRIMNRFASAQISPLAKLSFIGQRGMGALEFEPDIKFDLSQEPIDVKSLVDLAKKICDTRQSFSLSANEELTMKNLIAVGTSAGGRQAKALISVNRKDGVIRSGQVAGQTDADYFLVKFGYSERSSSEIEMAYAEMVRLAGIQISECGLLDVEGQKHFMTKRFDRKNGDKMHVLTLAAMNPHADSYEKLIDTCRMLNLPATAIQEIFRRMIFNVLANNTDDHNRNFSFIMDKKGNWSLAPAYDITYIFNERGGFLPKEERCLMINGKKSDITYEDLMKVAALNNIHNPQKIIQQVTEAVKNFRYIADKYNILPEWSNRINSCINRNLLKFGMIVPYNKENCYQDEKGCLIKDIDIQPATNGAYHLLANVDNIPKKFIIGQNKQEYEIIRNNGECVELIPWESLKSMVDKYLLKKDAVQEDQYKGFKR